MNSQKQKTRSRSKEYNRGYADFLRGVDVSSNPYDSEEKSRSRRAWFDGWYDARHVQIFPDWLML